MNLWPLAGSASAAGPTTRLVPQLDASVTAAAGVDATTSTTRLLVTPERAVTNQPVTLTAEISSSSTSVRPAGQTTFFNRSDPLAGCVDEPVSTPNDTATVTCQTSFAAATSPEQLRAVFMPRSGSGLSGSIGGGTLTIGRAPISIALLPRSPTTEAGSTTTYTARLTSPAGSVAPTGGVEFLDRGKAVGRCTSQPLTGGSAACTLSYATTGRHAITAVYRGDQNFLSGAAQTPQSIRVIAQGRITSFTHWTFAYTPTYTTIQALWIKAPPVGATVLVKCTGDGCPFARRSRPVPLCKSTLAHECKQPAVPSLGLGAKFQGRRLHPGTNVTLEITRPGWIGKYYRFKMRAGRGPKIQISCLAPGRALPGRGCTPAK